MRGWRNLCSHTPGNSFQFVVTVEPLNNVKFELNHLQNFAGIFGSDTFAPMKFAVKIMIVIFLTFLATPTIVSVIKKNTDTSMFYSMSEEELVHKEVKELKAEFKVFQYDFFNFEKNTSGPIVSENELRHDNVTPSIFSPPPNV